VFFYCASISEVSEHRVRGSQKGVPSAIV